MSLLCHLLVISCNPRQQSKMANCVAEEEEEEEEEEEKEEEKDDDDDDDEEEEEGGGFALEGRGAICGGSSLLDGVNMGY